MKLWSFEPLDSLFFREAKPFNAGEGGFLNSIFPPSAQTLAGAIRGAIGEAMGVDWADFHNKDNGKQQKIADVIGPGADNPGRLSFAGSYVLKDGHRLYPVPLHLLYSKKENKWGRLRPAAKKFNTDQGNVRLPEVATPVKDETPLEAAKPLEHAWLNQENMQIVLNGGIPVLFYTESDLFEGDARTGIGRNNQTRQAEDGQLYFTRHIRLKDGVSLGMEVTGADDVLPADIVRLGGEGRMAHLRIGEGVRPDLIAKDHSQDTHIIILLTHGDFDGKAEPEFLGGLELVSACVGKAVREGGWDYAKRQPKPLKSLVPAGSVYFVKGDLSTLGRHIGKRTAFGYGEIAIGIWEDITS